MKALIAVSLLLASLNSFAFDYSAQFGFQGESSIPDSSLPSSAELPARKNIELPTLNVLVFPHTLKSDWLHGKPDDSSQLELSSKENFEISFGEELIQTSNLKLTKNGNSIRAVSNDGRVFNFDTARVKGTSAIKLNRVVSPDKSHSYLGTFTLQFENEGIQAINHVDLETYLRGVVPKESGASWPLESLKAQALAARSYAYYHFLTAPSSRDYHVDDTARFQVYAGVSGADSRTDVAVEQTRGEIMTYQGRVIVAYFHAYSGGRTDSALNIFKQNNVPYCAGNAEIFPRSELSDELSSGSRWIVSWTTKAYTSQDLLEEFKSSSRVGSKFTNFNRSSKVDLVEAEMNDLFESVKTLSVEQSATASTADLDFADVRSALGWSNFPGYHFRVTDTAEGFIFKGHGWGHHVGLSQWGAFIMAKNYNKNYLDIVNHYYNDIDVEKLPWSGI